MMLPIYFFKYLLVSEVAPEHRFVKFQLVFSQFIFIEKTLLYGVKKELSDVSERGFRGTIHLRSKIKTRTIFKFQHATYKFFMMKMFLSHHILQLISLTQSPNLILLSISDLTQLSGTKSAQSVSLYQNLINKIFGLPPAKTTRSSFPTKSPLGKIHCFSNRVKSRRRYENDKGIILKRRLHQKCFRI